VSTRIVSIPKAAYGRILSHTGVPAGGKKKDLILLRTLFITPHFGDQREKINGVSEYTLTPLTRRYLLFGFCSCVVIYRCIDQLLIGFHSSPHAVTVPAGKIQ